MEWEAPALVLSASPHGEGGAVVHVLTAEHGPFRGLVRGGASRTQAATWQAGNMVSARWFARLADQLGTLSAELVHPTAARVMNDRLLLAMVASCCALADGALPEREPHPRVFDGLLSLLTLLSVDPRDGVEKGPAALLRWEAALLADLGYGLDLSRCAISGDATNLRWVSPRTGRAVSEDAAGVWRDRLLPLPPLLLDPADTGDAAQWRDGLRLTGHFLARDVFGHRHKPLPPARDRLYDLFTGET